MEKSSLSQRRYNHVSLLQTTPMSKSKIVQNITQADISITSPKSRHLENLSPGLPSSLFSFYITLEEVDKNETDLNNIRPATRFSPSSPTVTLSTEFDDIYCETVNHRYVSYCHYKSSQYSSSC